MTSAAIAEARPIVYSAWIQTISDAVINQPWEPPTDFDQNKNSDAEHKAPSRKSLIGWAMFIAGTLIFFVAADAVLMK